MSQKIKIETKTRAKYNLLESKTLITEAIEVIRKDVGTVDVYEEGCVRQLREALEHISDAYKELDI